MFQTSRLSFDVRESRQRMAGERTGTFFLVSVCQCLDNILQHNICEIYDTQTKTSERRKMVWNKILKKIAFLTWPNWEIIRGMIREYDSGLDSEVWLGGRRPNRRPISETKMTESMTKNRRPIFLNRWPDFQDRRLRFWNRRPESGPESVTNWIMITKI